VFAAEPCSAYDQNCNETSVRVSRPRSTGLRKLNILWCKQVLRLIKSRWEGAQPAIGRDRVGKSIGTTLRVSVGTYLPSIPSAVYPIRS
jgi:hypothetical protein